MELNSTFITSVSIEIIMDRDDGLVKEICAAMKKHPDNWKDKLSDEAKRKLAERIKEKRIKDSVKIIKFLNQKKVDYVVLKGLSLWYFDHGRDFEDIDILLDRDDVEKVANLLNKEFGYTYYRPEQMRFLKDLEQTNNHDVALIAPKMIGVELHYRMLNYLDQHKLSLMSDRIFLEFDGVKIPCQSKELQLLETFLHNVYLHLLSCDRDKWARDLNILIENYDIDWKKFLRMTDELRQTEVIYLTAKMLKHVEMPPPVLKRMAPASWRSYLKKPVLLWAAYLVWDRLFPPKDILIRRFHIKEDSVFFFLSYPANWIRMFFAVIGMILKRSP